MKKINKGTEGKSNDFWREVAPGRQTAGAKTLWQDRAQQAGGMVRRLGEPGDMSDGDWWS